MSNISNNLLKNLNDSQKNAVTTTEGFVRVVAGAGSGKTRALSTRFAYLVNEIGILPENILCVTFTNKSAAEMRARIHNLTGDNDTGFINTFHGFCVSVLQEESNAVQYPKSFLVIDNSDINQMLQIIYDERNLTLRDMTFGQARDMIEMEKIFNRPDYYKDMIEMSLEVLHEKYLSAKTPRDIIFYGYLYQEKKCFALDYNDLLKFTLYIFQSNQEIREKWQNRLEYIMIDEFQDIDFIQYELMKVLCGYHKNLFVVGDPDQTIYTWRGANGKYLLDFDKNFPGTKTIMMMENYRSTKEILDVANSLISKNKSRIKKDLIPMKKAAIEPNETISSPSQERLLRRSAPRNDDLQSENEPSLRAKRSNLVSEEKTICYFSENAEDESKWICEKIKEMCKPDENVVIEQHRNTQPPQINLIRETKFSDICILYRAHYVTRTIEDELNKQKIPYTIYSGVQFYDRAEIKDALSYLRMICYKDDLSFLRICNTPKRNLGERRIAFLKEFAEKNNCSLYDSLLKNQENEIFKGTKANDFIKLVEHYSKNYKNMQISELMSKILDGSGYEKALRTEGSQERLDNLAELKQSIFEYEANCGEEATLEHYLSHVALFSNLDTAEKPNKVKLMTVHAAKGLEFKNVFLCGMNEGIFPSRKIKSKAEMEEERRLCFVAITRAEERLFISEREGVNLNGSPLYPSRFILDIDKNFLDFPRKPDEELIKRTEKYVFQNEKMIEEAENSLKLKIGDKVNHAVFGNGEILEIDEIKKFFVVQFEGIPTPRKISFKANLKAKNDS